MSKYDDDDNHDEELERAVQEALTDYKFQRDPLEKMLTKFSNLANTAINAFRITSSETSETYIIQTESQKQFKITIESINSYKDAPWNS